MNYVDRYVEFYQGENKKEIYRMIDYFCESIRSGEIDNIKDLLSEDCTASISMIAEGIRGVANICEAFIWPGPEVTIRKFNIFNYVCRIHNNYGQIYFYTQNIMAKEDENEVHPFVFGGQFCISIEKSETWKIKQIKYDLMYDYGNTAFVKGKWKLMNYSQFFGHKQMIFHESDSPWTMIVVDDEPGSELEQILENRFRSAYAMDAASFLELYELSSDKKGEPIGGVRKSITKGGGTQDDGKQKSSREDEVKFQKEKVFKEPRLQHVMMLGDIQFTKDKINIMMLRSEYNRLYNQRYTHDNIHSIVVTVCHPGEFIKENGQWISWRSGFDGKVIFESVDDDCIRYDDYICGGRKWIS